MEASDGRPLPRGRQLQGPRPPRLSVTKDSHKIRKPPLVPQPPPPPRAPVIIYDASPKVIHTQPSEFMALVQRLTGPAEADAGPSGVSAQEFLLSPTAAAGLSPAARYAAMERSVRPMPPPAPARYSGYGMDVDGFAEVLGPGRPGIPSPVPSALPPAAAAGLFSLLPFDLSTLSWLNELSPFLSSARGDPPFASSPGTMPSPTMMKFFSDFPDL